jgi:hypothetical protein
MKPERIEELADQCVSSPVTRRRVVAALLRCAKEAREEALEEAAMACDEPALECCNRPDVDQRTGELRGCCGYPDMRPKTSVECASAIRAMKEKK